MRTSFRTWLFAQADVPASRLDDAHLLASALIRLSIGRNQLDVGIHGKDEWMLKRLQQAGFLTYKRVPHQFGVKTFPPAFALEPCDDAEILLEEAMDLDYRKVGTMREYQKDTSFGLF